MLTSGSTSSMMTVTIVSGSVVSSWGSAASRSRMLAYCGWAARQKTVGSGEFTKACQNCRTKVGCGSRKASQAPTTARRRPVTSARVLTRIEDRLYFKTHGFGGAATDSVLNTANPSTDGAVVASGKPLG